MSIVPVILLLSSLAGSVSAQFSNGRRRRRTAGGVIAGIVVAVVCGVLLCLLLSMLTMRRRRRGQTMLPRPGGGYVPFARPTQAPPLPQTHGYNNYNQGQPGQGWNNTNGEYQPQSGAVPPPYPGKETYPGQNTAPQPGGFAPPPGPPPPAHIGDGVGTNRFSWFNKRTQ